MENRKGEDRIHPPSHRLRRGKEDRRGDAHLPTAAAEAKAVKRLRRTRWSGRITGKKRKQKRS
jgi:hypothetical protein